MSKLLGEATAPPFRFDELGDGFTDAPIVDVRDVQQHDHDSKLPLFWPPAGAVSRRPTTDAVDPKTGEALAPVMQLKVVVDARVVDPTIEYDDGLRAVYLRAQSLQALRADLKRTRSRDVVPGGRLTMHLDDEEKIDPVTGKRRGIAKKIYSVRYTPPDLVDTDDDSTPPAPVTKDPHQASLKGAVAKKAAKPAKVEDEPPF